MWWLKHPTNKGGLGGKAPSLENICLDNILVNVAKRETSTFPLKTIEITTKHLILCSSIKNMFGKTLITTQQSTGTLWESGGGGGGGGEAHISKTAPYS